MVRAVWEGLVTVAAGPIFNFILAFVAAVIIVALVGYDPAEVYKSRKRFYGGQAGASERDIIKEYQGYHIDLTRDLYLYMYLNSLNGDETVHMTVERVAKGG